MSSDAVLTFVSVDEILKCQIKAKVSDKSYRAVLSCGAVFMLYEVVLT